MALSLRTGTYGQYWGNDYNTSNALTYEQETVNVQYLAKALHDKGWSANAIAGMCGNFQSESSMNPGRWQGENVGSGPAYGLAQWDPFTKYTNWAQGQGLDPSEMDTAIARIEYEIANGVQWISTSSYPLSFQDFKTSNDTPYNLAMAWLANYERPANPTQPARGNQAEAWKSVIDSAIAGSQYSLTNFWQWCVDKCNAPNVGYSQAYRNQQTVNGVTYYDCSSFVNYGLLAGGWQTPSYAPDHNAFVTGTMGAELLRLGWVEVDRSTMKVGDIGVSNNSSMQHTEVVYAVSDDGTRAMWMGAHTDEYALAEQVSITQGYVACWFDHLYRWNGGGVTPPVKPSYQISISGGQFEGGGTSITLQEGDSANIQANGEHGRYKFSHWELAGAGSIGDIKSKNTSFTAGAGACTITAIYFLSTGSIDPIFWPLNNVYRNQYRF